MYSVKNDVSFVFFAQVFGFLSTSCEKANTQVMFVRRNLKTENFKQTWILQVGVSVIIYGYIGCVLFCYEGTHLQSNFLSCSTCNSTSG